jgi:hypothetical protein
MKLVEVAENDDLGDRWEKVHKFAILHKKRIWLAADGFTPSVYRWVGIVIEMPSEKREDFICRAVSSLKPDEVSMFTTNLYLWWD